MGPEVFFRGDSFLSVLWILTVCEITVTGKCTYISSISSSCGVVGGEEWHLWTSVDSDLRRGERLLQSNRSSHYH
jgi:hypothetical protein